MRVFVAWDSQLNVVDKTFTAIRKRPPTGMSIELLGAAGQVAVGLLDTKLRAAIEESTGLLAVIDQPNANVGWEVGLAWALGLRVALATEGEHAPGWVRGTPMESALRQGGVGSGRQARALLNERASWVTMKAPRKGKRDLLVCPDCGVGEEWRLALAEALPDWELLDTKGWTLSELPARLEGVRRLALVVLPLIKGEERHGVANTIGAMVAGYAEGLGVPIAALMCADGPEVADLTHRRRDFDGTEEGLIAAITAWVASLEARPTSDLSAWRDTMRALHANPLAYVARMGLTPTELVPVDLDVDVGGRVSRAGWHRSGRRQAHAVRT